MSEFKGTRGPWEVKPEEVDKNYIRIRGTRLGERFKIANVLTPTYEGVHEREAKETRANANLIAAAPDLLDALQNMIGAFDNPIVRRKLPSEFNSEAIRSAREAINKALGKGQ